MNTIKTRTVTFTYGTAKDAALKIPDEDTNLYTVACLIRESYLDWMFARGGLMSDEVLLSCIGKANFFAGALGGWETRLDAEKFAVLKDSVEKDDVSLALAIVRRRNPSLTTAEAYRQAAKIRNLDEGTKTTFLALAEMPALV
jgi:hypothetical protein